MKKILGYIKKPVVAVVISALLAAIPLSFSNGFFLSWFAFVPLFFTELKNSENRKFGAFVGRWFLFGFVFNTCIYYWYRWLYPLDFLGLTNGMSVTVVVVAWIFTSVYHAMFFVVPGVLSFIVAKKIKSPYLTVMTGVVGILVAMKLTEYGEFAFPWVRISLGQYRVPILIQSASLWGIEGVDFLILMINALLALALFAEPSKRKIYASVALAVFLLNIVFGAFRLNDEDFFKEVPVTVVQGNILVDEKWNGVSSVNSAYQRYEELTKMVASDDTELVVWPETAVPINIAKSTTWQEKFRQLSAEIGIPIYMGVNWRPHEELFNSAVMVDEVGVSEPCSKRVLVPFGEKIPYRDTVMKHVPQLKNLKDVFTEYTVADGAQIMETDFGKIGSVICFESIFPQYSREITVGGAETIFVITNDAWLEDSPATYQHLAHSVFRSVENSRDIVRCANVGVSAFIDSRGRIKSEIEALKKGTLTESVSFKSERTVYNTVGYLFFPMLLSAYLVVCVVVYLRKKYSSGEDETN